MRYLAGSGASTAPHANAITEYLDVAHIRYELIEHERVSSAAAEARVTSRPPGQVAKTVVLHDGCSYVIAVIPASERLDLQKLRALLGATSELDLVGEEEIARDFPAVEVGALPPFGPVIPGAEVVDRALLRYQRVLCPAGDHRHSLLIDPHDVLRITAAHTGDICQD